jgi:Flp pilus assembly protein TadG
MKAFKQFWRDTLGATAVEFAFIGLFAIVLCVATLEFGRIFYLTNELGYAADRGTRLVLLNPQISDADVIAEVQAHLRLANTDGLEILTSQIDTSPGTSRSLSISLPVALLIPNFRPEGFRVSVQREVPAL